MDYDKMTSRQALATGTYDGWHEAAFVLQYGRPSGRPAPAFTDPAIAAKYAEGVARGQKRHAADLEVNGKPITENARAINAAYRAQQTSASPVAQWTAEPGLTAGSHRWTYTHPQFEGWSIYDAGQGGEITVYHHGDEPLGFEDMAAAVQYVAETGVKNLVPEPSPVVDPLRIVSDDELKALVSVETIERTLRLAIQVFGNAQDNPDDAERLTRRGMLLLSHAAGEASGRMATAVKGQDLADRIAVESRARFEVIRDDVNRQQKQEMAPHNLSPGALSLLVDLRDRGGRRLDTHPDREELAAAELISADHQHWYITPAGRAATEGLATCEHNVNPHECTHPPMTEAQRQVHALVWATRREAVAAARAAGQEPPSSVLLYAMERRECEAAGIAYVGPYAATAENDTSFTAEERECLTALRKGPVYALGAKPGATTRLREYKLIETDPYGMVALTEDGLLVAKAIAG